MTFSQDGINQAAAAKAQARQQIENARKIMMDARQEVADSIKQQVIEIKAEHAKQAAEAAKAAAKKDAEQQPNSTITKKQVQLAKLLMMLTKQTEVSQEKAIEQAVVTAQRATEISAQAAELFQALSTSEPQNEETINSES